LTRIAEIPESRLEMDMHLPEPQWNTIVKNLRNPRFAEIADWLGVVGVGSRGGVKAVEGNRSPNPGGTTERHGVDAHPWGLRRGVCEADGGLVGMDEIQELPCDFILQDADAELFMRRECPEMGGGKAESRKLKIEIGNPHVEFPELPESGCDFIWHDADGELVMRQECPEMRGKAEG